MTSCSPYSVLNGWVEEIPEIIVAGKPVVAIIRFKQDEESFSWSCVAAYYWPHKVILKNALTCPTVAQARAIKKHFISKGITNVEWDRRKGVGRRKTKLKIGGNHDRRKR